MFCCVSLTNVFLFTVTTCLGKGCQFCLSSVLIVAIKLYLSTSFPIDVDLIVQFLSSLIYLVNSVNICYFFWSFRISDLKHKTENRIQFKVLLEDVSDGVMSQFLSWTDSV